MFQEINSVYLERKKDRVVEEESSKLDEVLSMKIKGIDIDRNLKSIVQLDAEQEDLELDMDISDMDLDIMDMDDMDLEDVDLGDKVIEDLIDDIDLDDLDLDGLEDVLELEDMELEDIDSTVVETQPEEESLVNIDSIVDRVKSQSKGPVIDISTIPEYISEEAEDHFYHGEEDFVDVEDGDKLRNILNLICKEIEV